MELAKFHWVGLVFLLVLGCSDGGSRGSGAVAEPPAEYKPFASQCESLPLGETNLRYCIQGTNGQRVNARQIVYVFHGMGGNAEFVNQYPNLPLSQELRTTMGDDTPLFIGLSTGPSGALSYNAAVVFQKGLAEIESRVASGAVMSRHLIGLSMGGHNATRLAAEGGASAFRSVSLLCPALMPVEDPHDHQEVAAYRARHVAYLDANSFGFALGLFRRTFPTRSDWQANNPFEFMRSGRFDGLQFFLSTGEQDNLGLIEGTLAWKNESEVRRIPAKMENLAGSHCVFNNQAFVDFVRAVL